MVYPGVRQEQTLYSTAKRVVDEMGKGQETLRSFSTRIDSPADAQPPNREILGIPQVDIIIVDIVITAETEANCDLDVITDTTFSAAPGALNRVMVLHNSSDAVIADDVVARQTLAGLNGNRVVAMQPIMVVATDDAAGAPTGQFSIKLSYILADTEISY